MRQIRVVTTGFDGSVRVTCPAPEIHAVMTCGGGWFDHNELSPQRALRYEIDKQVNNGRDPKVVKRHVHALAFGGLTDAEFFELIRDRDCAPYGTAHELWGIGEIPTDRWFRNAWRRSHNGGPIIIDLEKARLIQAQRLEAAILKVEQSPSLSDLLLKVKPRKVSRAHVLQRLAAAQTPEELKAITLNNIG